MGDYYQEQKRYLPTVLEGRVANPKIIIYGTNWCGDCLRARRCFDRQGIVYEFINIDHDNEGERFVTTTNHGMRSVPTILFEDGSILVEPSTSQLEQKISELRQ